MGLLTTDIKTMDNLFLHQLEDIDYAEQRLTKALPKMAARNPETPGIELSCRRTG